VPERHIALALSGGGHRAAAFALGVVLYLARAGKTAELSSVASVSGGSLANGVIAQDLDLTAASPEEVEPVVARTARALTGRGSLFGARLTLIYITAVVVLVPIVLVAPWQLPLDTGWKVLVFVAAVIALGWFAGLRGRVAGRAFARTLFTRGGRPTRLEDVHTGVDHVICATDLHRGEHVYFSASFVYAYAFGLGVPGDLPLHRAVQASAAFPGAFPVAWMGTGRFAFEGGLDEAAGAHALALHDGGVYDNMADQWAHGLEDRRERGYHFQDADELVVANASAGLGWGSVTRLHLPWAGELLTLLRDKSVLYDNGNSVRRRELVSRFDLAERDGTGLRGSLVHISQSPFTVPNRYAGSTDWPERSQRAAAALDHLRQGSAESEREWKDIAKDNAGVKTTLAGIAPEVVARLIRHAYILAMVNLHVILGYPLLEIPSQADCEQLVRSGAP
jgi:predicted acylesterase/phospholipase RssA